jgi:hypothetical protein
MTNAIKTPALRLVALAVAGTLTTAIPASAMDRDPADQVPNWISESSFEAMSAHDVYKIDRAQDLGKRVVIEGHTVSESRELVDAARDRNMVTRESTSFEQRSFAPQDPNRESLGR